MFGINYSHPGYYLHGCSWFIHFISTGWNKVIVNSTTMAAAVARWYFNQSTEKHVDPDFAQPLNPSCGYGDVYSVCNNCANAGLGSNCLWNGTSFHGLE